MNINETAVLQYSFFVVVVEKNKKLIIAHNNIGLYN